ncbi:MAG: M15 family metallopeptidase [Actinobacteria bacterium]|nr:M15 family metallopeptidase [Actinomycetota bacterium]
MTSRVLGALLALLSITSCASPTLETATPSSVTPSAPRAAPRTPEVASPPDRTADPNVRPGWLGQRVLPLRPDGFGMTLPTPEELRDRRLPPPPDDLPELDGPGFSSRIGEVPDEVLERSTWQPACPVTADALSYVLVRFWGFDGEPHTGELLVNRSAAQDLVTVFRRLFEVRLPIEEMRVVRADELDAEPTGDGNNTTAFVCRPTRGSSRWSQHAYGLAIDVNPFHNPYQRGDLVLPELASAYTDRSWQRPGMILPGDEVTRAFADIGWGWGGDWRSPVDPMHFSSDGT